MVLECSGFLAEPWLIFDWSEHKNCFNGIFFKTNLMFTVVEVQDTRLKLKRKIYPGIASIAPRCSKCFCISTFPPSSNQFVPKAVKSTEWKNFTPRSTDQLMQDKRNSFLPNIDEDYFQKNQEYLKQCCSEKIGHIKFRISSQFFPLSSKQHSIHVGDLGLYQYLFLFRDGNIGNVKIDDEKAFGKLNYKGIANKKGKITKISHCFKKVLPFGIQKDFTDTNTVIMNDIMRKKVTETKYTIKSLNFHYYLECEMLDVYFSLHKTKTERIERLNIQ